MSTNQIRQDRRDAKRFRALAMGLRVDNRAKVYAEVFFSDQVRSDRTQLETLREEVDKAMEEQNK